MTFSTIVMAWLAVSLGFNYPAIFAYQIVEHEELHKRLRLPPMSKIEIKKVIAECVVISLVPIVGTLVAVFDTGFMDRGFRCRP